MQKDTHTATTKIEQAKANGYTKPVIVEGDWYSLELLVRPTEDLQQEYEAFDCEDNRMVTVKGWLFETKPE